jgi:hypothetical protein
MVEKPPSNLNAKGLPGLCQGLGPSRNARLYWFAKGAKGAKGFSGWVGVGEQKLPIEIPSSKSEFQWKSEVLKQISKVRILCASESAIRIRKSAIRPGCAILAHLFAKMTLFLLATV